MRILFNCPDIDVPSGGVKQLYRYAWLLSSRSYEAYVVHTAPGFRATWHGIDAPVLYADDSLINSLTHEDIVVFNEIDAPVGLQMVPNECIRVVWSGSWSYIYPALSDLAINVESWSELGIDGVITPSERVASFIDWSMGLTAQIIPPFVDPSLYYLDSTRSKKKQIAYMQRKAEFAPWLETIAKSRRTPIAEYQWIGMLDLTEDQYAQVLRDSMIYLVCGTQEGINLSAIEAMASGCLVFGFSGGGGMDYMIRTGSQQNVLLVDGNDYFSLGTAIEKAVTDMEKNPDAFDHVVRNGLETASRFTDPTGEIESLERFLQKMRASRVPSLK